MQHCTDPPTRSHLQRTPSRERRDQGKRKEKISTDFKEAAWCPSAVVQGAARQKNCWHKGSARGNWDSREGQQPSRLHPNGAGDRTTTLRLLLIGAVFVFSSLGSTVVLNGSLYHFDISSNYCGRENLVSLRKEESLIE